MRKLLFILLAAIVMGQVYAQQILFPVNNPVFRAEDNNGKPLANGNLYVYEPGTTNEKTVYTDYLGSQAHDNPISLNSRGEAVIYAPSDTYKFVGKTSAGTTMFTMDYVSIGGGIVGWASAIINAANAEEARDALGLGSMAVVDAATSTPYTGRGVVLEGGSNPMLPAVDGSQLGGFTDDQVQRFPAGHIHGMKLEWVAVDEIRVTSGECRDVSDATNIVLINNLTKKVGGTWVSGDGANGLIQGGTATNNTLHVFVLFDPSQGTEDIGFDYDLDPPAPLAQPGYTHHRRVGSIVFDASTNIREFTQYGDYFSYDTIELDVVPSSAALGGANLPENSETSFTLSSIPHGINVRANINWAAYVYSSGGYMALRLYPVSSGDQNVRTKPQTMTTLDQIVFPYGQYNDVVTNKVNFTGITEVWTNTSRQINARGAGGAASDQDIHLWMTALGYTDNRGRFD